MRFRSHAPAPPFEIGGEYLGGSGRHYLRDAFGAFELTGAGPLFSELREGDLITAHVHAVAANSFDLSGLKRVVEAAGPDFGSRPHAERFPRFVADVREFLIRSGLVECFTPTLVICPGLEPSLEPFQTELTRGQARRTVYLPTSPEVHLKKAIARGWHDVFDIKSCFRRGEFSPTHESEFLMLEWYRGFADLNLIERDLRAMLSHLNQRGWIQPAEITVTDFAFLFNELFGFELTPRTTRGELLTLSQRLGVESAADDTFNDLFHRVMIAHVEPAMAKRGPLIVKRFPPSQAALAKLDADGWADRFEFYWNGLEIANAFNEVNDPEEQVRRWAVEGNERARLGTSVVPEDPELITALRRGFPPTGGIALGLERLYMAAQAVADIRQLRLFSARELIP